MLLNRIKEKIILIRDAENIQLYELHPINILLSRLNSLGEVERGESLDGLTFPKGTIRKIIDNNDVKIIPSELLEEIINYENIIYENNA